MSGTSVSIVVPTFRRPKQLAGCLDSLSRLQYPQELMEVIVVDDGSPEPVDRVVAQFSSKLRVRTIRQENQGPAAARNRGLEEARGNLIAFTDDDCQPDVNWVQRLVDAHRRAPQAALGGLVINAMTDNLFAESSQLLVSYLYEHFQRRSQQAQFFTSNNIAFPVNLLRDMGGFHTSFPIAAGEDREICERWARRGMPLLYVPEAVVHHRHNLNFVRFVRQQFNYGRGAWFLHQTRRTTTGEGMRVERFAFYRDMLLYPFRVHHFPRALQTSFLLGLSQAANVSGFFWERRMTRPTAPKL